jgi:hypothetical protein
VAIEPMPRNNMLLAASVVANKFQVSRLVTVLPCSAIMITFAIYVIKMLLAAIVVVSD